jgi:hypothetical protein
MRASSRELVSSSSSSRGSPRRCWGSGTRAPWARRSAARPCAGRLHGGRPPPASRRGRPARRAPQRDQLLPARSAPRDAGLWRVAPPLRPRRPPAPRRPRAARGLAQDHAPPSSSGASRTWPSARS